jgi:PB1 domain
VSQTANVAIKEKPLKAYKVIFGEDIRWCHVLVGATISKLGEIINSKYSGLNNFLMQYHDKEGDLVTITTVEKLYLAEDSANPQSSVRLYISEVENNMKYVKYFERGKKVSGLMRLDLVRSNRDVALVQYEGNDSDLTHEVVPQEYFRKGNS